MKKILILAGFLVGMNNVVGKNTVESGAVDSKFSNDGEYVICKEMSYDELRQHTVELDCATDIRFEKCELSGGVFCTSARSLTFVDCEQIKCKDDVLFYVGIDDFSNSVIITIKYENVVMSSCRKLHRWVN